MSKIDWDKPIQIYQVDGSDPEFSVPAQLLHIYNARWNYRWLVVGESPHAIYHLAVDQHGIGAGCFRVRNVKLRRKLWVSVFEQCGQIFADADGNVQEMEATTLAHKRDGANLIKSFEIEIEV